MCADEKTSIQARCRCHPTLPPGRAPLMRVEHEYKRHGATQYLAAYDVHRAKVSGRCEPKTGIVPFGRLVEQVMTAEPYASAERVSGLSTTVRAIGARPPSTASRASGRRCASSTFPCTPRGWTSARSTSPSSRRKVLKPNDFTDVSQIEDRLLDFEPRYNALATPYHWKFSRADLNKLLARIAAHERDAPVPLELAAVA